MVYNLALCISYGFYSDLDFNFFWLERVGAEVVECACVIGLPEVKVRPVTYCSYTSYLSLNLP